MNVAPIIGGERFEIEARLSFKELSDGTMGLVPHTIRKEPKLDEEFMGVIFTPEDKENLKTAAIWDVSPRSWIRKRARLSPRISVSTG